MTYDGKWINCWKCGTEYFLPPALHAAARSSADISFFCPYGHSAHFPEGLTGEDKQRRRAERAEQQIEYEKQRADLAERRSAAQKGVVTRIKNRVGKGVCPCCNRTFQNLARHMNYKHPDYSQAAEDAA